MKVNNEALHTPLLGDELIDNDEESLLQVVHDKQDDDGDGDDDKGTLFGIHANCWDFVFLLSIQCQMTWSIVTASPRLMTTVPYNLQFVTMSIATFGFSTWLYRISCADCPKNIKNHLLYQNFVLLLPELLTIIVIFILFTLGKIGAALVALHCGSLLLSVLALGMTVRSVTKHWQDEQEEVEQMESSQVGILTV
jgi:hypothetical protein